MIEYAVTHKLNAIVGSNLASPDRARGFIDRFAGHGYRTEVRFVAGPSALSRLGVLPRYQHQVDQFCTFDWGSLTGHRQAIRETNDGRAVERRRRPRRPDLRS
jgi:zeta toxin